jgi:hypothetical protein
MTALHEIMDHLTDVHRLIDETQGELDDDLEAQLDKVEGAMSAKINSCLRYADSMAALAAEYKERATKYTARHKALTSQSERLRDYVMMSLKRAGRTEYKTEDYPEIKIRQNRESVKVDMGKWWNDSSGRFIREKPSELVPDKENMKKYLQTGKVLPYAELVRTEKLVY